MARIETPKGLKTLLERLDNLPGGNKCEDFDYWYSCVKGCIEENLAMDEVDYENSPSWFRPLWRGLK